MSIITCKIFTLITQDSYTRSRSRSLTCEECRSPFVFSCNPQIVLSCDNGSINDWSNSDWCYLLLIWLTWKNETRRDLRWLSSSRKYLTEAYCVSRQTTLRSQTTHPSRYLSHSRCSFPVMWIVEVKSNVGTAGY